MAGIRNQSRSFDRSFKDTESEESKRIRRRNKLKKERDEGDKEKMEVSISKNNVSQKTPVIPKGKEAKRGRKTGMRLVFLQHKILVIAWSTRIPYSTAFSLSPVCLRKPKKKRSQYSRGSRTGSYYFQSTGIPGLSLICLRVYHLRATLPLSLSI